MKKTLVILTVGFTFLILGAFGLWKLIDRSTPPPTPKTSVTIPEGWTVEDINTLLQEEGILKEANIGEELEGYLFPDTYEFFLDSSLEIVQNRFRDNFEEQISSAGFSPYDTNLKDIITVASLIEREVQDPKEMRIVAGILWKRIESGIPLQVDATLCYLKKKQNGGNCLPITKSDKSIDSLYNTYLYSGLPPGPIGSPGLNALKAAVDPAQSSYWYYISDPQTGKTIFARTLDEHNHNIVKYLGE